MSGISATYLQWSPGNEYASKEEIPLDMIVYDAYGAEEEVWEQYGLILGIDEDKACHMGFMDEDQKLEFLEKTRKMTLLDMYDAMVNLVKATGEISRYQGIKDSEQARLEAWKYHDKVCEAYEIATRCIYYNDLKPKAAEGVNHDANGKAETPEYIQNLIEKKLLYPDGKRVLGSLDALIDALGPQPAQFIQETFLKANGKPYTLKHIQDVMAGRKLAD